MPTPNVTSTDEPVGDDVPTTDDMSTTPAQPRVLEPRLASTQLVHAAVTPPPGGVCFGMEEQQDHDRTPKRAHLEVHVCLSGDRKKDNPRPATNVVRNGTKQ